MEEQGMIRDIHDYADAWTDKMVEIWIEKIERLKVIDTGSLHESFDSSVRNGATGSTISLRFLEYGLAQEFGVGNGYAHDNGGDLQILDPQYRESHGLNKPRRAGYRHSPHMTSGKPRERRRWFQVKYFTSVNAMVEAMARIAGDHAAAAISDTLLARYSSARL